MADRERRQYQRLQLRLPLSGLRGIRNPEGATVWTRNVSAGGMAFEMPAEYAPQDGAEVAFELTVPPGEGYASCQSKVRGAGKVVRKVACGKQTVAVAVSFSRPLALSLEA